MPKIQRLFGGKQSPKPARSIVRRERNSTPKLCRSTLKCGYHVDTMWIQGKSVDSQQMDLKGKSGRKAHYLQQPAAVETFKGDNCSHWCCICFPWSSGLEGPRTADTFWNLAGWDLRCSHSSGSVFSFEDCTFSFTDLVTSLFPTTGQVPLSLWHCMAMLNKMYPDWIKLVSTLKRQRMKSIERIWRTWTCGFNADGLLPVKKRSFEFCNLGGFSFSAQWTQWFKQEPSGLPNASYLLGFDYPSLAAVPCSSQPHLAQGTQLAWWRPISCDPCPRVPTSITFEDLKKQLRGELDALQAWLHSWSGLRLRFQEMTFKDMQ